MAHLPTRRLPRICTYLCLAICLVLSLVLTPLESWVTAGSPPETWGDVTHAPVVSNGPSLSFDTYLQTLRQNESVTGALQCTDQTLPLGPNETDGTYAGCWYDTSIGLLEAGGMLIRPPGQPYAGLVNNTESQLFPTPNRNVFVELTPNDDWSAYYLNFRTAQALTLTPSLAAGYPISYNWAQAASSQLTYPDGSSWSLSYDVIASQVAYSSNGKWLVLWDNRGLVTRVDLANFSTQILQVETPEDQTDYATMTVSDDGRFVVVNVQGKLLRMYDMATCSDALPVDNVATQSCSYRALDYYLNQFVEQPQQNVFGGVPKFVSDDLLSFYTAGGYDENDTSDYYEYYFRAPNTARTDYIALGDSYASGEGEGNSTFYPETDVHGVNMCHLSKQSYPFLIGKDLGLDSTHSVACSGAKTTNIANG